MTHTLGRFIVIEGSIPAGSAAEKLFRVFTAGEKPVEIQYIQTYGGDVGEAMQLILCPPNQDMGVALSTTSGTLAISANLYIQGGTGSIESPMGFGSDNGGRGAPRFTPFVIPPYATLAAIQGTSNSTVWVITVGGFEIA
jgi:hypothetical protein